MIRLRLERRSETPHWLNLALPLAAILATLIICSGLVALAGSNVLSAYAQLFLTPFSTGFDLEQTAIKSAPLVLTGLAVAVAFRARFWKNPRSAYPTSPSIRLDAQFPILPGSSQLHLGVLIAVLAVPAVWFIMNRTTFGFAIKAVGENARAAAYAGIHTAWIILATAGLSGALAGLAGVGEVGGVHYQVMTDLSPGYGYTGIVIAMLARLEPLAVLPAAIFFAVVITGAEGMSRATGVPVFLADVIQGVSLLCMLTALLFTQYRLRAASHA